MTIEEREAEEFDEQAAKEHQKENDIKDITVLHMTVPCCTQITRLVSESVKQAGKKIPVSEYVVGIQGGIKKE